MEKTQIEQILEKYEEWNTHGKNLTSQIIDLKQGKDYDLVSTNWQRLFRPIQGAHYHFGSKLYLIYKPKLIVHMVDDIDYDDGPAPEGKSHTNLRLDEQEKQVIVTYDLNDLQRKVSEIKTSRFRWVATKRQGRELTFKVEEIRHWEGD